MAFYQPPLLYLETGEVYTVDGEKLQDLLFDRNLLAYHAGKSPEVPDFLAWLIPHGLFRTRDFAVAGFRFRRGRYVRRLLPASVWSISRPETLIELRDFFTLLREHAHSSPAGLGQQLMRKFWTGPQLDALPLAVAEDLGSAVGGRAELYGSEDVEYRELWELDMNSAYPNALRRVPAGRPGYFAGSPSASAAWWMARCEWTPPAACTLPALPLPRVLRTAWPTEGTYTTWLTAQEHQCALEAGYRITIDRGYAWPCLSQQFVPWVEYLFGIRSGLEPKSLQEGWVKQILVASIGRFGSSPMRPELVEITPEFQGPAIHEADDTDGSRPLAGIRLVEQESAEQLPHLSHYVNAEVRCQLWRAMRQHDDVIACNFDAFFTLRKPEVPDGWKLKQHTNVSLPHRRWLISDQDRKTPGMPAMVT